jgi:hypothetical protein
MVMLVNIRSGNFCLSYGQHTLRLEWTIRQGYVRFQVQTDISEIRTASIIRVMVFITLMTGTLRTFEKSVYSETTRRYIPEGYHLQDKIIMLPDYTAGVKNKRTLQDDFLPVPFSVQIHFIVACSETVDA